METIFERVGALDVHKAQVTRACALDLPRFGGHGVIRRPGSLASW